MRKRALSQHVALVSVKRDRAKEGLRINEGLGAVSSLLRAGMFERQICQDGCGVSASQDQAFSSFQRQVKMSRRGAAGARHKMSSLLRVVRARSLSFAVSSVQVCAHCGGVTGG